MIVLLLNSKVTIHSFRFLFFFFFEITSYCSRYSKTEHVNKTGYHRCRYDAEIAVVLVQSAIYLGIIAMTRLAKPSLSKLCYRGVPDSKSLDSTVQNSLKLVALWCIPASYIAPFFIIPHTVHPLLGWTIYLLGVFSLCSLVTNAFVLPTLQVLVPWLGTTGPLMVMAFPWYPDGVVRGLCVFGYAFCCAPFVWESMRKVMDGLQLSLEREAFLARLAESSPPSGFNKLC